jgi:hypothetical protein
VSWIWRSGSKGGITERSIHKIKRVCVFIKLTQKWTKHHHFKIGPRKKVTSPETPKLLPLKRSNIARFEIFKTIFIKFSTFLTRDDFLLAIDIS